LKQISPNINSLNQPLLSKLMDLIICPKKTIKLKKSVSVLKNKIKKICKILTLFRINMDYLRIKETK